ncbi:MAG: hypothetical protein GY757_41400 [bacterium]|nr:hypothetical protein [bacterium]
MGLAATRILKVIEKKFKNNGPALNIADISAQEQYSEKIYRMVTDFGKNGIHWLLSLRNRDYYDCYKHLELYNKDTTVVFSIDTARGKPKPEIVISFNYNDDLIIEGYDNYKNSKTGPFMCRGSKDIESLLNLIKTEYDKAEIADKKRQETALANSKKHQKIRELKYRTISAKIKELAEEKNLTYALVDYHTKVKFFIRLTDTELFEIDIPYKHFQTVLQNIKTAVTALFQLREKGITIKHRKTTTRKAPIWR